MSCTIVGGWELRDPDEDAVWADTVLALDLQNATGWRAIPAPFRRRALAVGTSAGRIHAPGIDDREPERSATR